jgi:hypothetical protein
MRCSETDVAVVSAENTGAECGEKDVALVSVEDANN